MAAAISIQGLTKKYVDVWQKQEVVAVNNLNLEVQEGEIFGFLGRNGAGKTTTIKMLLGLVFPTSGDATLLGKAMGDNSVKSQLAYLPEETYFYDSMTAWELLDYYGRLFRIPEPERSRRVQICLEKVRLQPDAWKRNIRGYSKGMRQRTGIAQALINDPKLLFLDEPTSGLDPIAHAELREIVASLKDEGKTVFLSSHQLADVEIICSRVAIIHRGKLLTTGTIKDLTAGERTEVTIQGKAVANGLLNRLQAIAPDTERINTDTLLLRTDDDDQITPIIDLVRSAEAKVISIVPHRRALEDVFVETVRREEAAS
ncbi:MAG: ABC-type multidrug transport system, ATPase component [Chthonomonadales bacterium]|nr:ABC-type multidrug transport system, ATPase component [Chthonomonadales bacterium]